MADTTETNSKKDPTPLELLHQIVVAAEPLLAKYRKEANTVQSLRRPPDPQGQGEQANDDLGSDAMEQRLKNANADLKKADEELAKKIMEFEEAAGKLFHTVYKLASRQENPAIFYDEQANSLAAPQATGKYDLKSEWTALANIKMVGISSGDTVKEVNRLLDHTSAKRIAEEMDIVTYHSNAARLFDRVRAEFNEASRLFDKDQNEIDEMLEAIKEFRSTQGEWRGTLSTTKGRDKPVASDLQPPLGDISLLDNAEKFLRRYWNFLDYAQRYAGRVGREFYTEASVDAYKDATRPHAQRIEKQGLFASPQILFMGVVAALAVAIILILFDNNLALKNWVIPAAAVAAVVAYLFSIRFGNTARASIMSDLRATLYSSVLEKADEVPPGSGRYDEPVAKATGRGSDDYFKFSKIAWDRFDTKNSAKPGGSGQASLGNDLASVSEKKWPKHISRMRFNNTIVFLAIAAIPVLLSYCSRTLDFGRNQSFAFISRSDELGSCVLEHGRVLMATGGSYFVETRDGNPVTEIAKSLVLRIEPSEAAAKPELPRCDERRPEPKPQDQTAWVHATNTLAENIKTGLDAFAGKLGAGQIDPASLAGLATATNNLADSLKLGLQAVAEHIPALPANPGPSASAAPVVIAVYVSPETQAGPTIVTMLYDISNGGINVPFLHPVTGSNDTAFWGKNGIDTVEKAFYFGASGLNDPLGTGTWRDTLHNYGAYLASCMKPAIAAGAPRLKLSVEGYASEDWLAAHTNEERQNLNLFLAEGRRIAAINALDVDPALIDIENRPGPKTLGNWAQVKADTVRDNFLFKTYGAMAAGLVNRHAQLLKAGKPVPIDFLARAAAVTIDGELPEQCRRPKAG
ncbi:hypothetical protein [Mesorhizobium sp. dw_380]|uniref:hypothetical protein n=1 Tax=Mesorhizobium sp. dw_380 TaxID=2812001 RepID=UPI001BDF1191|nr:hypothetical protein [Mesorhizobium sp. dw_380]